MKNVIAKFKKKLMKHLSKDDKEFKSQIKDDVEIKKDIKKIKVKRG